MTEIIRHCPDCGSDNPLRQHHGIAAWCPDTAEEYCPEWYCPRCGAALVIGEVPGGGRRSVRGSAAVPVARNGAAIRDRVA
ncbi:MAG TPA: hypothetical protein VMA72_25600 [Streptosporangiaceae bacterium]|nr:hypothetical protein [Streptosporangiaceae bacterium]